MPPPQKKIIINWAEKKRLLGKTYKGLLQGSEILGMTFEGLGKVFEGYSADTGAGNFLLMSMEG